MAGELYLANICIGVNLIREPSGSPAMKCNYDHKPETYSLQNLWIRVVTCLIAGAISVSATH